MKSNLATFKTPVLISSLIVLPLILLEFRFNIAGNLDALGPKNLLDLTVLFGLLWLLPIAFMLVLTPIVQGPRARNKMRSQPLRLGLGVVLLILIALIWGGILVDQFPCFIGVPNCD